MPMRFWALPLLGSGMLAMATPAQAQSAAEELEPEPRRYNVEIILFRYADSVPSGNEQFLPDAPPVDDYFDDELNDGSHDETMDEVLEFGDLAGDNMQPEEDEKEPEELAEIILPARRVELVVTARDALTMQAEYDKLQLLDAYEPLMWTGWTQTALEQDVTPRIPLRRLGNAPIGFDGELQLYLSRFLHLVVDLTLTPRQQNSQTGFIPSFGDRRNSIEPAYEPGIVKLRMNEDRIFRNGELRYFDHPKFGLLAKVTRVEETEPQQPDDVDSDTTVLPAGQ